MGFFIFARKTPLKRACPIREGPFNCGYTLLDQFLQFRDRSTRRRVHPALYVARNDLFDGRQSTVQLSTSFRRATWTAADCRSGLGSVLRAFGTARLLPFLAGDASVSEHLIQARGRSHVPDADGGSVGGGEGLAFGCGQNLGFDSRVVTHRGFSRLAGLLGSFLADFGFARTLLCRGGGAGLGWSRGGLDWSGAGLGGSIFLFSRHDLVGSPEYWFIEY